MSESNANGGGASEAALKLGPRGQWPLWMAAAVLAFGLIRTLILTFNLAPLHFDEAQYWSYGEALDLGYYSKPPMTAWLIRLSTELFGDTAFGVRFFVPWLHGLIAWFIFLTGCRLFDGRTGFWAGLAYLTLPAVSVSSNVMSTDPPMMAAWAAALYALVRALQSDSRGRSALIWWASVGVAIGLGLNSKYTIIAFVGGCAGYALFSREGRLTRASLIGPGLAILAALLVWAPNLWWNAQNDFASISHVADNAKMGRGPSLNPGKMAEFIGAQIAIFGPILFIAVAVMLARDGLRGAWAHRLLLWLGLPLLGAMVVQALLSRAHPNWAAPAYIALTLATVSWLLDHAQRRWVLGSAAFGALVLVGFTALGLAYRESPTTLTRTYDPFKKTRPEALICAKALPHLRAEEKFASNSRRLLAVCMFMAKRGMEDIRIEAHGKPGNHYQLAAPLVVGEKGEMLYIVDTDKPEDYLRKFATSEILERGVIETHGGGSKRRFARYSISRVSGFLGFDRK
ncbi:MAG: glycosyltransferase family 39 protein [Neomegalonema sp.]|nr:glycosyltransferase family 39 protein [Neomegalonema sp.]